MDVFISYSKKDKALLLKMEKLLKAQDYTVWWDDRIDPNQPFDEHIRAQIDAAHAVLVLWTANSVQSVWVKEEASRGNQARKLVQARFDDCTLPMGFGFFQYGNMEARRPGLSTDWKKIKRWLSEIVGKGRAEAAGVATGATGPTPASDQTLAEVRELKAMMAKLLEAKAEGAVASTGEAVALAEAAAQSLVQSTEPLDQRAGKLIEQGRIEEALSALKQDAASADADVEAADEAARRAREAAFEKWSRIGALAALVNVGEAIEAYEHAARLDPGDCWTHIYLCRLHLAAGSLPKARRAAEAALRGANDERDQMCAFGEIAKVATREGNLPAVRVAIEKCLRTSKDLSARDPGNTEWKRDLSISYNKLGDVAVAEGDLPAARKAYEDGLAIHKELSARDPGNTEWKRDLSVSYNKLGDVARAKGDLPAARKAYEDGLAIAKELSARDPGNTEWKRDLSVSYNKLGDVARAEGDLPAARKAYEDGLAIRKDLSARDPDNTEWKRDLSVSHNKLGDVARAEGDLPAARTAYEDGLAIAKELSARDPGNTQWKRDLSVSCERLGDMAEQGGDVAGALRLYEQSLPIAEALAAKDKTNATFRNDVEITRRRLAQLRAKLAAS